MCITVGDNTYQSIFSIVLFRTHWEAIIYVHLRLLALCFVTKSNFNNVFPLSVELCIAGNFMIFFPKCDIATGAAIWKWNSSTGGGGEIRKKGGRILNSFSSCCILPAPSQTTLIRMGDDDTGLRTKVFLSRDYNSWHIRDFQGNNETDRKA